MPVDTSSELPKVENKLENYFSVVHHSPPTPPTNSSGIQSKRVRFSSAENTENIHDEMEAAQTIPEGAAEAVAAAAVSAVSDSEKINKILLIVASTDASIKALSAQVTTLETAVNFHDSEIMQLRAENTALKSAAQEQEARMGAMAMRMTNLELGLAQESRKRDDSENVSRKQCLEISGVPKLENEQRDDAKKIVAKVMALAGSTNNVTAIDDAHRKMGGGLIARFKTREQRNEVYSRRFNLTDRTSKELPGYEEAVGNDIYINESLTTDRSQLMACVRAKLKFLNAGVPKLARTKCKTSGGVIQVQNTGGNYLKVTSMSDFDRMHPNDITLKSFNN